MSTSHRLDSLLMKAANGSIRQISAVVDGEIATQSVPNNFHNFIISKLLIFANFELTQTIKSEAAIRFVFDFSFGDDCLFERLGFNERRTL